MGSEHSSLSESDDDDAKVHHTEEKAHAPDTSVRAHLSKRLLECIGALHHRRGAPVTLLDAIRNHIVHYYAPKGETLRHEHYARYSTPDLISTVRIDLVSLAEAVDDGQALLRFSEQLTHTPVAPSLTAAHR